MKIAITANGQTLSDKVINAFEESPFLLIYETETGDFKVIEHDYQEDPEGTKLASAAIEHKCEGVITGEIEEKAFYLIADEGITRFKADGMIIRDAISQMEARELVYIRDYKGAPADHHHHS